MIMSGNEAWDKNVLNADRRGRHHVVRQAVPGGGSGDWEGPAADGIDSFTDGTSRRLVRAERMGWPLR